MDFLGGSIRIGRFFGINVRIHNLFLIFMAYNLLSAGAGWKWELAFTTMLFGIVLVHEFGHCFGARSVGGDAQEIMLWPLGGLAFAHAPMTPWAQFVTVACGPLVNVIFCLVSGAALAISVHDIGVLPLNPIHPVGWELITKDWQVYTWLFFRVNYVLLCFNMLPIFPLDGGQLFWTIIWPFLGLHRASIVAAQVGLVGAAALGVWGASSRNFMLVGIAIFGAITSWQHLQAARAGLHSDRFTSTEGLGRARLNMRGGFWSRFFRLRGSAPPRGPTANPNPGAWEAKLRERDDQEAELDSILRKVSEQGINSLSYVERQALERATRERQARERAFDRENSV